MPGRHWMSLAIHCSLDRIKSRVLGRVRRVCELLQCLLCSKFKMVSHQLSTVQFPSHQFVWKVHLVQFGAWGQVSPFSPVHFTDSSSPGLDWLARFSSGFVQSIEFPMVWEERRSSSRSLQWKSQPAGSGFVAWVEGWWLEGCWLCLLACPGCGVVLEWRKFSSKSFKKSSSVHFACLTGSAASLFSSV